MPMGCTCSECTDYDWRHQWCPYWNGPVTPDQPVTEDGETCAAFSPGPAS